ncbi:MAG: 6,7-dimethyl-8-ribityllumazine synthase [Limisphaerales bacterium]
MLKPVSKRKPAAVGGRYVIVASRYNTRYVDSMLRAARAELKRGQAREVVVVRVPGAFEIPVVVGRLTRPFGPGYDAVICLGVILRGQTTHAEHIGTGVTHALIQLQIETGCPIIHEVLLLENEAQARERCLGQEHNRGTEAAQTAIEMVRVMRSLPVPDDDVPF